MAIRDLERLYANFIDKKEPLPFFKGLAEYLEYVFKTPEYYSYFIRKISERRLMIGKIEKCEKLILKEIEISKQKLLQLLKKSKVKIDSLERFQAMPIRQGSNLLKDLQIHEKGGVHGNSPFLSDGIIPYLFDIAANLKKAGYESELKEFMFSSEDYGVYYRRINGPSKYTHTGNQYGNFLFSKTLPKRYELVRTFEAERILKPWGSFERLMRFKIAFELTPKELDTRLIPEGGIEQKPWFGGAKETFEILGMAHDLQKLVRSNMDFFSSVETFFERDLDRMLEDLNQEKIKEASQVVHAQLSVVSNALETSNEKISLKGIVGFDDERNTLKAGKKECVLPPYKNEHFLCRAMFKRLPGEAVDWTQIYQEITGVEYKNLKKDLKLVQDTMYAVNKRVKTIFVTDDDLFSWLNKSVKRNF